MKIQSLHLRRFKRFQDKELDLTDPETGLAKDLVVLIGDNGAGKSTVLQSIAAVLGTATRRLAAPSDLDWPGFSLDRASAAWASGAAADLVVELAQDEVDATTEYFHFLQSQVPKDTLGVEPGRERAVRLFLEDGRVRSTTPSAYFQCRGREYARQIVRSHGKGQEVFKRVGQIFWYTEQRTALSITPRDAGLPKMRRLDLPLLRERLANWYYFHRDIESRSRPLRAGERDIYVDIQNAYKAVFPDRRLEGPVPRADADEIMAEPWFQFHDGRRPYELEELSGGERAVFPLILDFAAWNIHRSVILIDEMELHLHPPMQQSLLRALHKLGSDNQFIITTHSDAIVDVLPEAAILRVTD